MTIDLNKVSLTTSGQSINLSKGIDLAKGSTPNIVINLNWNHGPPKPKGFFASLLGSSRIDLDVGLLYELQSGATGSIQALGDGWGNFSSDPYIELDDDDRTGQSTGGENIRVNGQHWSRIKRLLVYAFIYEGAANWDATDGVVTITMAGEAPVEVRMTSGQNSKRLCGIALIENDGGQVKITRVVDYFPSQLELDQAHGWGLEWSAGRK